MQNKTIYLTLFLLVILIFSSRVTNAQNRLEGLINNPKYATMLLSIDSLKLVQDSLIRKVEFHKEQSKIDSIDKNKHISKVFLLENKLFDLRNKIGVITSKCGVLEQDYLIKNINSTPNNSSDSIKVGFTENKVTANKNMFLNQYFIDNLSAEEFKILSYQYDTDSLVESFKDSVKSAFNIVENADEVLRRTQDIKCADSMRLKATYAISKAKIYEDSLMTYLIDIFDTKVYVYNRLLDKLNVPIDKIKELNNKLRDAKSLQASADTTKFTPILNTYPRKRKIILEYEKLLCEKLVYLSSLDSIKQRMDKVESLYFNDPAISLPQYDYIDFYSFKIGGSNSHKTVSSIEKIETIPTNGSIYMIRLMTLNNKITNVSGLKGVNPVVYFINENGKYEYYAGMYNDKAKAENELERLRKIGFNSPIITTWRAGGRLSADGKMIVPITVNDFYYRIELDSTSDVINGKISEIAPNKELSRIGDKLYVGIFKSYMEAHQLFLALEGNARIITVDKIN